MTGPAARSYFGFIYSRGTPVLPGEVRYQPASISCPTRFQRAPEPGPNSRSPQAGAIQHFAPPRTPPSTLNLASSFGLRCDESTGQDGVAGGRPRERSPSMRAQARRQSFNGRPRESPSASSRQASSGQDGQPSERPPRRTGLALTTGSGLPATALDSPDRVYIICVRIVRRSESGRLFHAPGAAFGRHRSSQEPGAGSQKRHGKEPVAGDYSTSSREPGARSQGCRGAAGGKDLALRKFHLFSHVPRVQLDRRRHREII